MAMSTGGGPGKLASDPNVTPLIDVLLVLLIIFMVIVPVTPHGLNAQVPLPPKHKTQQQNDTAIVVQVFNSGNGQASYKINQTDIALPDMQAKLAQIFATRAEKVMFIKGDPNCDFQEVAKVIDIGTAAGVDHIGIITPKIAAGQ
uniref:Biopolymer transporter ExbD n=1 Tax=Acidobacterium capsulatum TaxID=33075 RepID=A0A7V4XS84_9BACT